MSCNQYSILNTQYLKLIVSMACHVINTEPIPNWQLCEPCNKSWNHSSFVKLTETEKQIYDFICLLILVVLLVVMMVHHGRGDGDESSDENVGEKINDDDYDDDDEEDDNDEGDDDEKDEDGDKFNVIFNGRH